MPFRSGARHEAGAFRGGAALTRARIATGAFALVVVLLGLAVGRRALERNAEPAAAQPPAPPALPASPPALAEEGQQGFLYGRVTTFGGATFEGRLRWGGGEEAFWGDFFNGARRGNPWVAQVPPGKVPVVQRPIEIFGIEIARREVKADLGRLFMARFGDISRIEAQGKDVRVTLRSGTVFDLDRLSASDFDDGVRVWDNRRGVVDLDSSLIRAIELLPTRRLDAVPGRLHGTVRTPQGDFTGFVQWDREKGLGSDELEGRTVGGEPAPRFDTIRSIARRPDDGFLVTLLDGREVVLSGTRDTGRGNRGTYVDDRRYGRVLVSRAALERVDFSPGGSGPAYADFPPGRPLTGSVTTRDGRRLAGRLVFDLDESETTETLDAPSRGVDYTIPFGLVASVVLSGREERDTRHARVTLHGGEELRLERSGDLGEGNAGMLVFEEGRPRPGYVPWSDVDQVEFDRPPATYPAIGALQAPAVTRTSGGSTSVASRFRDGYPFQPPPVRP
ncbi:MAG: hypothetical protein IPN83_04035 [Holophagales bacterium]|nr:hypothetical protein [Holophagales bacterium]